MRMKTDRSTLLALSVMAFNADSGPAEKENGRSVNRPGPGREPAEGEVCAELVDRTAA